MLLGEINNCGESKLSCSLWILHYIYAPNIYSMFSLANRFPVSCQLESSDEQSFSLLCFESDLEKKQLNMIFHNIKHSMVKFQFSRKCSFKCSSCIALGGKAKIDNKNVSMRSSFTIFLIMVSKVKAIKWSIQRNNNITVCIKIIKNLGDSDLDTRFRSYCMWDDTRWEMGRTQLTF